MLVEALVPEGSTLGLFPPEQALLTALQTAKALKVSARTLAYWTARCPPLLNTVKIGKVRRYVVADVLRFIEEHKVKSRVW